MLCSSHFVVHRPPYFPPRLGFRVSEPYGTTSDRIRYRFPLEYSRRLLLSGRICNLSCFRNEDSCYDISGQSKREEVFNRDNSNSDDTSRNWKMDFQEAAYVIFRDIGKPWTVPWTLNTIFKVMLLWTASFWFIGSWVVPFAAHMTGFHKDHMTYRWHAFFGLLTDMSEGLAGVVILSRCLSPFLPLPSGWFRFSLEGGWLPDVVMGCLMFPLVNRVSHFNLSLLPRVPSSRVSLTGIEQSIAARDRVAMALYAAVVSVCAPVWEEIIFRGFLLPSLTRYMPVWCSILLSSLAFALAHFSVQKVLPLVLLGVVIGLVFSRSRNLLPSMLLHSLWNGFVFLDLMNRGGRVLCSLLIQEMTEPPACPHPTPLPFFPPPNGIQKFSP